jgi:hypothetical protein
MNAVNRKSKNNVWFNVVFSFPRSHIVKQNNNGQAVVEFTLVFVLFLVVAWIPADYGLAFLTGQLALNASREGARIAAADPCLKGTTAPNTPCLIAGLTDQTVSPNNTCTLGADCPAMPPPPPPTPWPPPSVLAETASRLSSALLPGATITVSYTDTSTCNDQVTVTVNGTYNYFFLKLLDLIGVPKPTPPPINRSTSMRWEHQSC